MAAHAHVRAYTRAHTRTEMPACARARTQVKWALSSFEWAKVWYWPCLISAVDAGDVVFIGVCMCGSECVCVFECAWVCVCARERVSMGWWMLGCVRVQAYVRGIGEQQKV